MIKVLFVCHGNICRSPMAEFIMKELVRKEGQQDTFHIESCAMTREEIGNDIYPPARAKLQEKHIPFSSRRARLIRKSDYDTYDYIIYMDNENKYDLERVFDDTDNKIYPLLPDRSVSDPWWTNDFERAYQDILDGCTQWVETILK